MAPRRKQKESAAAPPKKRRATGKSYSGTPSGTAISIPPEAVATLFSGFQSFFQQVSKPGVTVQVVPPVGSPDFIAETPMDEAARPGPSSANTPEQPRRVGTRSQSAPADAATSSAGDKAPSATAGNASIAQLSPGTPACLRSQPLDSHSRSGRSSITSYDSDAQDQVQVTPSQQGTTQQVDQEKGKAKKTGQKKSKKTKRKELEDDSGTSSSSSDEDDGILEGYWGQGEDLIGLPIWAHERRANSHRKTFNGTLEWKNGALVEDVKTSTFVSSDFILGNHLSSKKRNKILNGDYVDIFTLLPPAKITGKGEKKRTYGKRKYREPRAERTFENWLDGFQVYMGTIVACYPKRAMHLLAYMAHVRRAYALAGEGPALLYDEEFRRNASLLATTRWDLRDQNFWGEHVSPYIEKKHPEALRSARFEPRRPSRRLVCWEFNKGTCTRAYCKYSHECEKCQGAHPASACFKGQQSFRGGRGNFRQGPRNATAQGPGPSANRY
nr:uncharacterized protein LOC118082278 isoform X2 [Zootoca vivipara]